MMRDDYDGQMIFGDLVGLKLPDIRLTGEENPEKFSPRKLVPTGDRTRAHCVTSAHATTCSTVVDALSEVSDELIVDRRTVSHWANRFRGSCVSLDNDPRLGRPRTSTDERSVKFVADALEEDHIVTCEKLSKAMGVPVSQYSIF